MTKREAVYQVLDNDPDESPKVISEELNISASVAAVYRCEWRIKNKIKPKRPTKDILYEGFGNNKSDQELSKITNVKTKTVATHRVAWMKATGQIEETTDEVIAKELNITKQEVKEAYRSALVKMKEYLSNQKIDDFNDFNDLYYIQAYIGEKLEQ